MLSVNIALLLLAIDLMSPICHWTPRERRGHRVVSLPGGRADTVFVTAFSPAKYTE